MREPKRIQRKRTKGWRMPESAVYVGRPSGWGNPYRLDRLSAHEYVVLNVDGQEVPDSWGGRNFAAQWATDRYRDAFTNGTWSTVLAAEELRGRDLACWCPLDQPCHADVLLEVANPAPHTCDHDCPGNLVARGLVADALTSDAAGEGEGT